MYFIYRLLNVVKYYDWGKIGGLTKYFNVLVDDSRSLLEHNQQETATKQDMTRLRQAELWIGDHPSGESQAIIENQKVKISQLISQPLPFLFKALTIDRPLSIQAHPNSEQASLGFNREKQLTGDFSSKRSYYDLNEKKEIILAYTPMQILIGFRQSSEIKSNLTPFLKYGFPRKMIFALENNQLKKFFAFLLQIPYAEKKNILKRSLDFCKKFCNQATHSLQKEYPLYRTILAIHEQHPHDFHALSPLWLNLVFLKEQEALYIPSRQIHSYLSGVGIEVMNNSDNVLRAGLTSKHCDTDELLHVVDFHPHSPCFLKPQLTNGIRKSFTSEDCPFVLFVLHLQNESHALSFINMPALVFCTEGELAIENCQTKQIFSCQRGESFLITANETNKNFKNDSLLLKGSGVVYGVCLKNL